MAVLVLYAGDVADESGARESQSMSPREKSSTVALPTERSEKPIESAPAPAGTFGVCHTACAHVVLAASGCSRQNCQTPAASR